jgi:D-glycero-D-manno-heptose 1,7-bisphosphate phosphatase
MSRYDLKEIIKHQSSGWSQSFNKPVVGLDRDGTIIQDMGEYITSPNQVTPIPGSLEAIKELRLKGHKLVILTNQAGISKGLQTEKQVDDVHTHLLNIFGQNGIQSIDGIYYSSSNLKEDIFAKPNIGMFNRAKEEQKIDWKKGWYVGDKISDLKAAEKAGAKPILVLTGHGQETLKKLDTYANKNLKKKTLVFNNLLEFAKTL